MKSQIKTSHLINKYKELKELRLKQSLLPYFEGELLYSLRRNGAYREVVGEGIDSWVDFLAQPELKLTRAVADKLIEIYEFIVKNDIFVNYLSDLPWQSMHKIVRAVKKDNLPREKWEEMINAGKFLSEKDFKHAFFDIQKPDTDKTYKYIVMKKCNETGSLEKVHEVENKDIIKAFNLK